MVSFSIVYQLIPGIGLIFVTGVYVGLRLAFAINRHNRKQEGE